MNSETKDEVIVIALITILVVIFAAVLLLMFDVTGVDASDTAYPPPEVSAEYNHVIDYMLQLHEYRPWVDLPIDTTIEDYTGTRQDERELFEGGSWYISTTAYRAVTGCVSGWLCDNDNLEIADCRLSVASYNPEFENTYQTEYNCLFIEGTPETRYSEVVDYMAYITIDESSDGQYTTIAIYRDYNPTVLYLPMVNK